MAITIHQQPDPHSAISTPLIIVASSDNSSNDGFMYVIRTAYAGASGFNEFLVAQNAQGYLTHDIVESSRRYIKNLPQLKESGAVQGSVHSEYNASSIALNETIDAYQYAGSVMMETRILEGYDVDGVFTINEASEVVINAASGGTMVYNYMDFSIQSGFQPDLLLQIGHQQGDQSRLMSDRLPSTHFFENARAIGLYVSNGIYIPTHESDYGQFGARGPLTGFIDNPKKVLLSILPSSGPPIQEVYNINDTDVMVHLPLYPANLNASTLVDVLKPSDYPNWKAIFFQILNEDDEQVSMTYVMYNAERFGGCLGIHNKVRLAWVGRRGGWEYFNFTKQSQESYTIEKKIVERVIGNHAEVSSSVPFSFNSFDESKLISDMKIEKYLTAESDWISEGEFEFMKGLFLSKQVHWVHDDGTHTPVIVQADSYEVKRQHGGSKKFNQQIKLLIAQEQFA